MTANLWPCMGVHHWLVSNCFLSLQLSLVHAWNLGPTLTVLYFDWPFNHVFLFCLLMEVIWTDKCIWSIGIEAQPKNCMRGQGFEPCSVHLFCVLFSLTNNVCRSCASNSFRSMISMPHPTCLEVQLYHGLSRHYRTGPKYIFFYFFIFFCMTLLFGF